MGNFSHKESEHFIAKEMARQKELTGPEPHGRLGTGLASASEVQDDVLSNTSRVLNLGFLVGLQDLRTC